MSSCFQLSVTMSGGVGISVINDSPEEIIYASLREIKATYNRIGNSDFLEASIKLLQADNQLMAGSVPTVLFTPKPKHVAPTTGPMAVTSGIGSGDPVLSFAFHRELQSQWHAVIFKYFQVSFPGGLPLRCLLEYVPFRSSTSARSTLSSRTGCCGGWCSSFASISASPSTRTRRRQSTSTSGCWRPPHAPNSGTTTSARSRCTSA